MPTPVSTAKQCLSAEASHALEDAVSVARRCGHAQTTSLHAVSALFSLSPSQLREACLRARNAALYPRIQLKALELCLSIALERLPTAQPRIDEPPVSNSLMAAIKRSQANQRRQPESIIAVRNQNQLLGQCHEQLGSCSGVKVELQHLIVSILDDPIVSRVFSDSGFRSFDVKLAILRPFQSFFRYPQCGVTHQGLFLSNLDGPLNPGHRPFRFPFSGNWGNCDGHEDYRRIGEVLLRKKGRNPLIVGVCAHDAFRSFVELLERRDDLNVLPLEVRGINVVSIEKDVLKFVTENWTKEAMSLRFKEVGMMVKHCLGPGLMVSFGNLGYFLGREDGCVMDVLNSIVRKLTKLLEVHGSKVWLIGFAANDQTYMEFLSRFPSIDKDWDLHLLPITSVKPLMGGESCFKSSLMGSFVPFAGLFSSPSDVEGSFRSSYQHVARYNHCNENFEPETTAFPKRGFMASIADQHKNSLTTRLQMADDLKAKGSKVLLGGTVESLQRKSDSSCQHLQHTQSSLYPETHQECFQFPTAVGSCYFQGKKENVNNERHSTSQSSNQVLLRSSKKDPLLCKLSESPSRTNRSPLSGSWLNTSGVDDSQTSQCAVSVVTELGLELFSNPCKQRKKESVEIDKSHAAKSSTRACFDFARKFQSSDFKALFEALFGRVGRQREAVRNISQIIVDSWSNGRLQTLGLRGDVWLNCIGPDLFGKRKLALALAGVLYGNENNFIHVDFYTKQGLFLLKKVFGYQITERSDLGSRGKTVVDHIAEELCNNPYGVVFLENVQSADPMAQHSLSQAIKTGKFSDSYGREVPINNRIFMLNTPGSWTSSMEKQSNFLEDRIARAKVWPLQVTVKTKENNPNLMFLNKRKLNGTGETIEDCVNVDLVKSVHRGSGVSLDLNLPAEAHDDDGRCDSWFEEFSNEVDKTLIKVVFDPFDYDALATKVQNWVHQSFCKVVGFHCSLEVEPRVMDQILAAACLSECNRDVEDWIDQVLGKGFAEAHKRYQLNTHSIVTITSCGFLRAPEYCLLPSKIIFT